MAIPSYTALGWPAWPFLVLAVVLSGCGSRESKIEQSLRQAAIADPRPVEGRLSVTGRFAPWNDSPAAHHHESTPISDTRDGQVLRGSRAVMNRYEPDELHRIGLLRLYQGATAHAVSALEVAAARKPSSAILSDLAAAYLALAENDLPWLHVDAIAAATGAVELTPREPNAMFNLALALERMSLTHESALAWERYLALETDQEWRNEASERLSRLREPTTRDLWNVNKVRARAAAAAGDRATMVRLARQFPGQVKELFEVELLPAWAEAVGKPAERARLSAAKGVAEALAESGERLYVDTLNVIERRPDAAQDLAEGVRTYTRGLILLGDCTRAMPFFESASRLLSAEGSPLAQAARFQQLVCVYRRRPSEAEPPLAELAAELKMHPYPTLLAKTEALRGLCATLDGRHSQAVTHYERAVQLLTKVGDADVTRFRGMLDEAYRFLGDRDGAWPYRLAALQSAAETGDRRIRHAVLMGFTEDLIDKDRREVARAVLDELLANAKAWSEPGAEAEALLRRSQFHLSNGDGGRAAADLATCEPLVEQVRQPASRERLETELMLTSAEAQLTASSAEAAREFLAVVSRLEASGVGLLLPRALLGLARAQASLGAKEAAVESFDRAIQVYEARREGTAGEGLRISFFARAQDSFDAMIRFQALERGDAGAAFAYSERARARVLRDRLTARIGASESAALAEQLRRIPPGVSVLTYAVLPEELLIWHLRQGSLKMHVLPTKRDEVAEAVASLRAALTSADARTIGKAAAARAFEMLVRPALESMPSETELVFVPDRELQQVPFSALFDSSRGRYLLEDHACLVAPSLELYLGSRKRLAPTLLKPHRVLAVGAPAFNRERFPALPELPAARNEAQAIAALYEKALPLVGEEATRQRILQELPGSDVLHLAAHVVLDSRNPLDSWVATADAHRPLRASDLNADRLTRVKLVFLAACDTAPGFTDGDREGVAGLARAFLAAGVSSVVATLWGVEDGASARLAEIFHARLLAGEPPEYALRSAQLTLLSDSSSAPFAWAPFQLFRGL